MQKKHRIFIAINLPEDIKRELAKYQDRWPELPAKWMNKDQLHITLEFLGDLTDQEMGEVCKITKEVAQRHKSFSISLEKVLYGPPLRQGFAGQAPKMVWVEGGESDDIKDLKEDLQDCLLEEIRFRPEGREFIPHITLCRISEWEFRKIEPEERPEVNEDISFFIPVESIEVMESELKRGGPAYAIIESCILSE